MKVLCCQKLNSKVKCWITNFSLNFLFSFFSTLSQQRIFCHCQNREKIWKTCGEIFIFAKTLAEASNFLGTASGTGLKTGLMGLASKSVHKIPQSPKLSEVKDRRYHRETWCSQQFIESEIFKKQIMLHPEVICALFPFDACYMKSNNSGGQQSAILQVHWADRGIFALESRVGQWSWNTSDYFQFFFIMLFVYDMVKKVFFFGAQCTLDLQPPRTLTFSFG